MAKAPRRVGWLHWSVLASPQHPKLRTKGHTTSGWSRRVFQSFEALDDSRVRIDRVSVAVAPGASQVYAGTAGYGLYRLDRKRGAWEHLGRTCGIGWWHVRDHRMCQFSSILFDPAIPGRVYYGHFPGGFFRSADGGETWTMRAAGMPPEQWPYTIAIDDADPAVMYVSTKNGQNKGFCHRSEFCGTVMKSRDGGATWFEVMAGLDRRSAFYRLLIHPEKREVTSGSAKLLPLSAGT